MKKILSLALSVVLLSSSTYADVFITEGDGQKSTDKIIPIGKNVFELPDYSWDNVGDNYDLEDNSDVKTTIDDYETVIIDRTTVLSLAELAERINYVDNSIDEIQALLLGNGHLLSDVSQYVYFKNGNDEQKNIIASIISDRRSVSENTLPKLLDETIALVRICYSSTDEALAALEECADILELNMYNYNTLTDRWKHEVADILSKRKCFDKGRFRNCFYEAVSYATSRQNAGGCGGSGGGSKFHIADRYDIYVVNTDKSAITEVPSDGTPVSVNVITYYDDEPVCYLVAIYDGNGKMKNARIFDVSANVQYEPIIFNMDTEYDSQGTFKLFALENMKTIKPIYVSKEYTFGKYIGNTVPQKEEETDGVIAIRGDIIEKNSDSIEIEYYEERHFGYWIEFEKISSINVSYSGIDIDDDLKKAVFFIKYNGKDYELVNISAN